MVAERTEHWIDTQRLLALSDGVFAIALTLLVLSFKAPILPPQDHGPGARAQQNVLLYHAIGVLWQKIFAYAVSFVIIARFWFAHHEAFRYIKRVDSHMCWVNMAYLLSISFLPFPVLLVGEYPTLPIATQFYCTCMAITGLMLNYLLYWASSVPGRLHDHISPRKVRRELVKNLIFPALFIVAAPVANRSIQSAWLCMLLIVPIRGWLDIRRDQRLLVTQQERGVD